MAGRGEKGVREEKEGGRGGERYRRRAISVGVSLGLSVCVGVYAAFPVFWLCAFTCTCRVVRTCEIMRHRRGVSDHNLDMHKQSCVVLTTGALGLPLMFAPDVLSAVCYLRGAVVPRVVGSNLMGPCLLPAFFLVPKAAKRAPSPMQQDLAVSWGPRLSLSSCFTYRIWQGVICEFWVAYGTMSHLYLLMHMCMLCKGVQSLKWQLAQKFWVETYER